MGGVAGAGFAAGGAYNDAKILRRAVGAGGDMLADAHSPAPANGALSSDDFPGGPHNVTIHPTAKTPSNRTNKAFSARHPSPIPSRSAHEGNVKGALKIRARPFLIKFILIL
jgi:hypothetical protein